MPPPSPYNVPLNPQGVLLREPDVRSSATGTPDRQCAVLVLLNGRSDRLCRDWTATKPQQINRTEKTRLAADLVARRTHPNTSVIGLSDRYTEIVSFLATLDFQLTGQIGLDAAGSWPHLVRRGDCESRVPYACARLSQRLAVQFPGQHAHGTPSSIAFACLQDFSGSALNRSGAESWLQPLACCKTVDNQPPCRPLDFFLSRQSH